MGLFCLLSYASPLTPSRFARHPSPQRGEEKRKALITDRKARNRFSSRVKREVSNFVNPMRILKLARELKKRVPPGEEAVEPAADDESAEAAEAAFEEWERPEVESKRLVATRRPWEAFGPLVATRAWECGFFGAQRKAFVGDGASNNWTLWRNYFSSFTPILDFIHALSYVFAAATAGRPFPEGWVPARRDAVDRMGLAGPCREGDRRVDGAARRVRSAGEGGIGRQPASDRGPSVRVPRTRWPCFQTAGVRKSLKQSRNVLAATRRRRGFRVLLISRFFQEGWVGTPILARNGFFSCASFSR